MISTLPMGGRRATLMKQNNVMNMCKEVLLYSLPMTVRTANANTKHCNDVGSSLKMMRPCFADQTPMIKHLKNKFFSF